MCVLYPRAAGSPAITTGLLGYTSARRSTRRRREGRAAQRADAATRSRSVARRRSQATRRCWRFALAGGRIAFADNCAACHGAGGGGRPGFPNLADDDWLWGGSSTDIQQTITHGIRNGDRRGAQLRDAALRRRRHARSRRRSRRSPITC